MTRAELEAMQFDRLRAMLARLVPHNRFYTPRLAAAGVDQRIASLDEFRKRMPVTLKSDLVADQAAHPPYGSNLTSPLDRYTRYFQTSGTTSAPLRWLDTPESWAWVVDNWLTVLRASGIGAGDVACFTFSFGPFLGFWSAFEAAAKVGCMAIPAGGLSSVARLRMILDSRATLLCCTPTYALRLGETAAAERIDLSKAALKTIIVAGEPGGSVPATRKRIEQFFPTARVRDHHGMTEVGPVSYECPARPMVLHVIESSFIAEVVDPATLAPVPRGTQGELILTNLGRVDSPLLRYRTGDTVRAGAAERCACGSVDLALEGGIIGRCDDMLVVRGVNVYPSAVEEAIGRVQGIAEYRVVVRNDRSLTELTIDIEPTSDISDAAALARRVEATLRETLGLRVACVPVAAGTLPRFEMKSRRWTRANA